jgi:nitric oxide synthase-interacting protein
VSGIFIPPSCCQTRSVVQKKDIKRQKERLEALKKEAEQEKARAKEAARERVLADFEKGQLALAAVPSMKRYASTPPEMDVSAVNIEAK